MTRAAKRRGFQILSDGRTVWVNGHDGGCLARFSKFGIDIHRDTEAQMVTGQQCLDCSHSLPGADEWSHFVAAVQEHHSIAVASRHRPKWVPVAATK